MGRVSRILGPEKSLMRKREREREKERFGHLQQGGCINYANCNAIGIGGFRSQETKGDSFELGLQA
jgi:hypothetical protein